MLCLKASSKEIAYLGDRIAAAEVRAAGRAAASVQDLVVRMRAVRAASDTVVEGEQVRLVEIGALFGIGLALMYEAVRGQGTKPQIIAIDPLRGYYEDGAPDVVAGVPITQDVLVANLDALGVASTDRIVIPRTSADAIHAEPLVNGESRIDVLVIDGDHRYEAVKQDFDLYRPLVRSGGIILFDDYGTDEWPDIQQFVNQEVASAETVESIQVFFRTAVVRIQ